MKAIGKYKLMAVMGESEKNGYSNDFQNIFETDLFKILSATRLAFAAALGPPTGQTAVALKPSE